MLVLVLPPVSFESLVFWWLRRVYGGRCKTCPSWLFPSVKIGGSLARNDCFGAPTCLVSSLWFSCGCAVSMGEAAKPFLFGGFQAGCHVVLRGRRVTLWHSLYVVLHGRRVTLWHSHLFDNVSKVVFVVGAILLRRFRTMRCSVRGRRSTLDVLCFLFQNRFVRAVSSCAKCLRSTLYILHFTLHIRHLRIDTLHSTFYTPSFTLAFRSCHFRVRFWHWALHITDCTLYVAHAHFG